MQFLHQTPEVAGLLYKRRGGFGKFAPNAWQYRFFAISKEGVLLYFDTDTQDVEHLDSKARGRLDLRSVMYDVSTEPIEGSPTPYGIQLFVPNEEKWKLCADTKEDQARWCKVLSKFVNQEAKSHSGRGIVSYTSDDEVERPMRRNTVAVTSSSSGSGGRVDGSRDTRPFSAPAGAVHPTTTTNQALPTTNPSTTTAQSTGKKRAKLSSQNATKTKDNEQFELLLVLMITNICFVGIYMASSIISTLFYVFLGNLVMGMTLQLRAGRASRLQGISTAQAAHSILREESLTENTVTAARDLSVTAEGVRSRGLSGHEESSPTAAADRAVINSMDSLSSEGGSGGNATVVVAGSGKPIAGKLTLLLLSFAL